MRFLSKLKQMLVSIVVYPISFIFSYRKVKISQRDIEIVRLLITNDEFHPDLERDADTLLKKKYGFSAAYFKNFQLAKTTFMLSLFFNVLGVYLSWYGFYTSSHKFVGPIDFSPFFLYYFPIAILSCPILNRIRKETEQEYFCVWDQILHPLKAKFLSIDSKNIYGNTLLHMALERRAIHKIKQLIKQKASVTIKNSDGLSAMHFLYWNKKALKDYRFTGENGISDIVQDFQKQYIYEQTPMLISLFQNPKLPEDTLYKVSEFLIEDFPNIKTPKSAKLTILHRFNEINKTKPKNKEDATNIRLKRMAI